MALLDYHDISLSNYIALGARIKVIYKTTVHRMRESHEERIGEWQDALREFNVAPVLRDQLDLDNLINFFRARNGPRYTFKIADPLDFEAAAEFFGTGDGTRTEFQLVKSYDSGIIGDGYPAIRPIILPDSGIQIFHDDILYTTGVSVDLLTGIVTFTSAPAVGVDLSWTGTFQVPVRFTNKEMRSLVEIYQGYEAELILMEQRAPVASYVLAETQSPDFVEVNFPTDWTERSSMGPRYDIIIGTSEGGESNRTPQFVEAKIDFEVDFTNRSLEQLRTILYFFLARRGRLVGFRVRDITDYTATNQIVGVGNDVDVDFQLYKVYQSGSQSQVRTITKPVSGTIFFDGVAAISQPAMDTATGIITFAVAPGSGVIISWTGTFDVPVRFDADTFEADITGYEVHGWSGIRLIEIMTTLPEITVADVSQSIQTSVSGCATRPFPEFQPVTKYILFPGDSSGTVTQDPLQLRVNNGFGSMKSSTDYMTSLTIAFAVSHLTFKGTIFKQPQPSSGDFSDYGAVIILDTDGSIMCTIGGGGVLTESRIPAGGNGTGHCFPTAVNIISHDFSLETEIDQDDMHIYCVTFDWYNHAIYVSGSVSGFAYHFFGDLAYETCIATNILAVLPDAVGHSPRYYFKNDYVANEGYGGVLGVELFSDPAVGAEAGPLGGFGGFEARDGWGGRMYELIMAIDYSPLPANAMVRLYHVPILAYLGSLYGIGYPRRRSLAIPGLSFLFRADSGVELFSDVQVDAVESWASHGSQPLLWSGRSGGSYNWHHPTQVAQSGSLPLANTDLKLARVPGSHITEE